MSQWDYEAPTPNDDILIHLTRGDVDPSTWNHLRFDVANAVVDLIVDKYGLEVPVDQAAQ
jgi:hypothetical protein